MRIERGHPYRRERFSLEDEFAVSRIHLQTLRLTDVLLGLWRRNLFLRYGNRKMEVFFSSEFAFELRDRHDIHFSNFKIGIALNNAIKEDPHAMDTSA